MLYITDQKIKIFSVMRHPFSEWCEFHCKYLRHMKPDLRKATLRHLQTDNVSEARDICLLWCCWPLRYSEITEIYVGNSMLIQLQYHSNENRIIRLSQAS